MPMGTTQWVSRNVSKGEKLCARKIHCNSQRSWSLRINFNLKQVLMLWCPINFLLSDWIFGAERSMLIDKGQRSRTKRTLHHDFAHKKLNLNYLVLSIPQTKPIIKEIRPKLRSFFYVAFGIAGKSPCHPKIDLFACFIWNTYSLLLERHATNSNACQLCPGYSNCIAIFWSVSGLTFLCPSYLLFLCVGVAFHSQCNIWISARLLIRSSEKTHVIWLALLLKPTKNDRVILVILEYCMDYS